MPEIASAFILMSYSGFNPPDWEHSKQMASPKVAPAF